MKSRNLWSSSGNGSWTSMDLNTASLSREYLKATAMWRSRPTEWMPIWKQRW
jgi:hypothetical protein